MQIVNKMRVNVIISTYNRPDSLKKTVESIFDGDYKDVCISIMMDGNVSLSSQIIHSYARILINEKRMDYVYSMNRLLQESEDTDAVLYASDDLVFPSYAISTLVEEMEKRFPDGNGLVGLNQDCQGIDSAFGLMGRKFIERFPERQVFCPDYVHFVSDSELGAFARMIKKFYFCSHVTLHHDRSHDRTWELGIDVWFKDMKVSEKRAEKKFLWGRGFELIGNGR